MGVIIVFLIAVNLARKCLVLLGLDLCATRGGSGARFNRNRLCPKLLRELLQRKCMASLCEAAPLTILVITEPLVLKQSPPLICTPCVGLINILYKCRAGPSLCRRNILTRVPAPLAPLRTPVGNIRAPPNMNKLFLLKHLTTLPKTPRLTPLSPVRRITRWYLLWPYLKLAPPQIIPFLLLCTHVDGHRVTCLRGSPNPNRDSPTPASLPPLS